MLIKKVIAKGKKEYFNFYDRYMGRRAVNNHKHAAPDFIIIGTMKGGTTSLFQYLGQHPDILPPKEKELAYFAWNRKKGLDWYLSNFPLKKDKGNKLTFEATPSYIYRKEISEMVSVLFPDIKAILLLRDPVKRAYSHWQFYHESKFVSNQSSLKDNRTFEEAIRQEMTSPQEIKWHSRYLDRGKYAVQIKNWYQYFNPQQLLILDSDELRTQPKKTLLKVTKFLCISDYFRDFDDGNKNIEGLLSTMDEVNNKKFNNYNINKYSAQIDSKMERQLRSYFRQYDDELQLLMGKQFSWMDKNK